MNDAELETQTERVHAMEQRWIEALGLRAWKIDYAYVRSDFEHEGEPSPDTIASCSVRWQYMSATISWNMPRVAELSDRQLEYALLHECMHIFLHELRPFRIKSDANALADSYDRDHEEHVATMLGWALLWTREAALAEGD